MIPFPKARIVPCLESEDHPSRMAYDCTCSYLAILMPKSVGLGPLGSQQWTETARDHCAFAHVDTQHLSRLLYIVRRARFGT